MIEKEKEYDVNNNYYKVYKYDIDEIEIINNFLENGFHIYSISLNENTDIGMGTIGGLYSYDSFLRIFPIAKNDLDSVTVLFQENDLHLNINHHEKLLTLITKDKTLELTDLISMEKNNCK